MSDLGNNTDWSETAASNNASPPNGWPEGMNPSAVNNSARENMAATKRFWNQINAVASTAGTSTAYTITYNVAAGALYDGELATFVMHATCGADPTLNKNSLGAKNLRKFTAGAWANVAAGELLEDQIVMARYGLSADKWDVLFASFNLADFAKVNTTLAMSGAAINEAARVDVASATTCDIGAAASNYVRITGTTTITGLGTVASGARRHVVFGGILTLTHNATSLILPTGTNITTAAGDTALFISEASGNWRCQDYERASGLPLALGVALFPSGTVIDRAYDDYTAITTITANIPADNSIPQVGEGTQILSAAITPKTTSNRVRVRAQIPLGVPPATSGLAVAALFVNGGTNAISANFVKIVDGLGTYPAVLEFEHVPGSTSAQTYTIRIGGHSFDLLTNADSSGRLGGGVSRATLILEEIVA